MLLNFSLKQIQQAVKSKEHLDKSKNFPDEIDDVFSQQYLNYLSGYTHNTIQLSGPEIIEGEYSEQIFEMLFHKYIYEGQEIKKSIWKMQMKK